MAHYVSSFGTLAACCGHIPGRESFCLSMAAVGVVCLAVAMALVLRSSGVDALVPVRLDD
ncbi:MAG: hypothetical protein HY925_16525 [Elusimicrobia bacterium]|nr:hypothetical protein [Elusimicrobiota bacterium]